MANLDEPGTPHGGSTNGSEDAAAPRPADPRVKELEQENARLRAELAELRVKYDLQRQILAAHLAADFPETEEEFLRMAAECRPFSELLDELRREFDLGPKP